MPRLLAAWFAANPPGTEPDEAAFAALAEDFKAMKENKTAGEAGTRVNYTLPETRSLITKTARNADDLVPPFREAFLAIDEKWADPGVWQAMRSSASPYTADFYLSAMDFERAADGSIQRVDENKRIYVYLFIKTFLVSGLITFICLLLAFPVAHLLATLPMAKANLLMILVLLPFWTSLLVRTTSWIVLLQGQGVLNEMFLALGLIDDEGRLKMIYNQTGTIIVMTHVLLPFMILPLYSVMRVIPPVLCAGGAVFGGDELDHVPANLSAADAAGDRGGGASRVHSGGGLFHHARAGGWGGWATDFQPDRLSHEKLELVDGGGAVGDAAGRGAGSVLAL